MLWKRGCVLGLEVRGLGLGGCGFGLGLDLGSCGLVNITTLIGIIYEDRGTSPPELGVADPNANCPPPDFQSIPLIIHQNAPFQA